jgi:cation diffusion facilitator CzcD-associated flavoprotein CzcO
MKTTTVIIGAGFAGICMAIKLKQSGLTDFVMLEKAPAVGGTWFFNRYPGAACDVPSCVYSFSFEPNPAWSRHFATQPEIEAYIHHCVEKYDLASHLRLSTEVTALHWCDDHWRVMTSSGEDIAAQFVVSAVGQLNQPSTPAIHGASTFTGKAFHSARWDTNVSLQGQRVAVIGSAASAAQLVPEVAKQAAHLRVFQRTPNYLIPRWDRAYLGIERWMLKHIPGVLAFYRWVVFNQGERLFFPAMRRARWAQKVMEWLAQWQLRRQVSDLSLRDQLTPRYEIGCKRVLLCDDYYPALMRPNVSLDTSAIQAIGPNGLVTEQGEYDCDVIVYATGFKTADFLQGIRVVGREGIDLHEKWSQSTPAYRSVCVAGFPNFFTLYGPNSNLGSNSIIAMIEAQVGFVIQCLLGVEGGSRSVVEVKEDVEQQYQQWLEDSMAGTVWMQDCPSWYKNANGTINNNWPWSVREFERLMAFVDWSAFKA